MWVLTYAWKKIRKEKRDRLFLKGGGRLRGLKKKGEGLIVK